MKTTNRALILAVLALAAPAFAQQPVDEKDVPKHIRDAEIARRQKAAEDAAAKANAANPAKPVERPTPSVKSTDPDVQALVKLLTGTFTSTQGGASDTPALSLSTCVITVDGPGMDNAVYFELARADSPWEPFRQGVWQVWKKNGNLTVRQYDFTNLPATFKPAMVGMWSAPDMFPVLKSTQLSPLADISLTLAGGNYSGSGSGPCLLEGAFEFTTSWIITPDSLSFTDRGVDITGKQVWGPATGAAGPAFKRTAPIVKTERRAGGVVVMDFVPPSATERKLEDHGEAAAVATFYTDGGIEFLDSNTPGRTGTVEPFRFTVGTPQSLKGLDTGALGMTVGTIRRIYIPTALAFGTRAFRTAPPNSDVIVTLKTQWVGEPKPPATAPAPNTPPTGAAPAGAAPAGGKPAAAASPAAGVTAVPADQVPEAVRKQFEEDQKKKREQQQPK